MSAAVEGELWTYRILEEVPGADQIWEQATAPEPRTLFHTREAAEALLREELGDDAAAPEWSEIVFAEGGGTSGWWWRVDGLTVTLWKMTVRP